MIDWGIASWHTSACGLIDLWGGMVCMCIWIHFMLLADLVGFGVLVQVWVKRIVNLFHPLGSLLVTGAWGMTYLQLIHEILVSNNDFIEHILEPFVYASHRL